MNFEYIQIYIQNTISNLQKSNNKKARDSSQEALNSLYNLQNTLSMIQQQFQDETVSEMVAKLEKIMRDFLFLSKKQENLKFTDLELIFQDLKSLFEKRGFIINWKALEKQSLDETINALAMASPFSLEEKQVLLEAKDLDIRKNKIAEILSTYTHDVFNNTTLQ